MRSRQTLPVLLIALLIPAIAAAQTRGKDCQAAAPRTASLFAGQAAHPADDSASAQHGYPLANMDRSVSPCTNFFQFAVGGWLSQNPIPAAYSSWGIDSVLADENEKTLHAILDRAAADRSAPNGSSEQKIGDFYASCMNTAAIDAEGAKPLAREFKRIDSMQNLSDVEAEAARLQGMGANVLFRFFSQQDDKNSTQQIAGANQGGLGLPDRDYYTKTDAHSQGLRQKYVQHVAHMFELLGDSPDKSAAEAKTVMSIETKLAAASMTRVEQRDPNAVYHKMDVAQIQSLTPGFSWSAYFREVGFSDISSVNVRQPKFFQAVDATLKSTPLPDWKIYFRWHLIHAAAPALSSKFVDENFDFFGRTLTGAKELQPRWKRCVQATDRQLGFALGQEYVKEKFPPEAKAAALKMVHNILDALHDDIQTLDWMGPATKQAALYKLSKVNIKVGYPDKWRDYSAYHVARASYVENVFHGDQYEFHRDLDKIGKPVDRTEWDMTPPEVNAYYGPSMNEIVFPAGILQPPYFDAHVDDAINYGGIGAAIGHEITHGFDDEGRQYDADGNLKNWWTDQDLKKFNARAECVAKQFDSFIAVPGVHENGHLVLGESIADLGGLVIAYNAFQKTPEAHSTQKIDGFTPDQRFFLSYGQSWEEQTRPEAIRMRATVDPHPQEIFRTNGPVSNMPAFAKAFGCHAGDPMARPAGEACRIW
ncbi:MAG: M13 family metallopeptidase [Candidatus Acidiferrales bacterium]